MNDPHRHIRDIQAAPRVAPSTTQSGPTVLKVLLVFLSVLVLVVSAMGYFTVGRLGNEVASASNLRLGNDHGPREHPADGAVDILLVGTDSRTDAQGNTLTQEELDRMHAGVDDGEENTDTMMVIRVPEDGSRATAVSIPRDTYVHDGEFGNMKINGVYAAHKDAAVNELADSNPGASEKEIHDVGVEAGRSGLIDMVGEITGVDVDHYAEIGLYGFVLLTDAVGGVNVCLNEPVDEPLSGANFPAGEQSLNGFDALAFVRQRHDLPRGDLDRIVRQQAFMASLVNQVLSAGTLTNPARLSELANAVERSVVIDEGWDVASFANQLADLAGGNVTFTTIPVTSIDGVGDYGESIVTIDPAQVQQFFDDMVIDPAEETETTAPEGDSGDPAPALDPSLEGVELHVLNAGETEGVAGGVGGWLTEQNATVTEVANAMPGIYTTSQVVAADPTSPAAVALSEMLGGLPVTANDGLDDATLIVVTADDYAGPTSDNALPDPSAPAPEEQVGTPGADYGQAEVAPEITAGGDGPRCIN